MNYLKMLSLFFATISLIVLTLCLLVCYFQPKEIMYGHLIIVLIICSIFLMVAIIPFWIIYSHSDVIFKNQEEIDGLKHKLYLEKEHYMRSSQICDDKIEDIANSIIILTKEKTDLLIENARLRRKYEPRDDSYTTF